jgi:hypothetical protein
MSAIPGLELMTALQNQSGQAIQAMQYGIQNRQNQRQLEQAERRLDMAEEEWEANAPVRNLQNMMAGIELDYATTHKGDYIAQKNLEMLSRQTEAQNTYLYNVLSGVTAQNGYDMAREKTKSYGMDLDQMTGGIFLGGFDSKKNQAFLADISLTAKARSELMVLGQQLENTKAAARYEADIKAEAERMKALSMPMGTDVKRILRLSNGDSVFGTDAGTIVGKTIDGRLFRPTEAQIVEYEKLQTEIDKSDAGAGKSNQQSKFNLTDIETGEVVATTLTPDGIATGVTADGKRVTVSDRYALVDLNPEQSSLLNRQATQINSASGAAKSILKYSDEQLASIGVSGKATNILGGALAQAKSVLGKLKEGETISAESIESSIIGSVDVSQMSAAEAEIVSAYTSLLVSTAKLNSGSNRSFTKSDLELAEKQLLGAHGGSLEKAFANPSSLRAGITQQQNNLFNKAVEVFSAQIARNPSDLTPKQLAIIHKRAEKMTGSKQGSTINRILDNAAPPSPDFKPVEVILDGQPVMLLNEEQLKRYETMKGQ